MSKVKITRHESVQVLVYSYVEGEGRKEGREREGMEEGRGKGDRANGRDERGHGMGRGWKGKGKEKREGKGGAGLQPPNFNSWRRHCVCVVSATVLLAAILNLTATNLRKLVKFRRSYRENESVLLLRDAEYRQNTCVLTKFGSRRTEDPVFPTGTVR